MAQRTATITHIRYAKRHKRSAKPMDVSDLPGGDDLLYFVHAVWRGLRTHALWDKPKQFYCDPTPGGSTLPAGRTLVMRADIGAYGDPSLIKDVETGEERLRNDEGKLTNAVAQRLVLLVPEGATSAFLYVEHLAGGRLGVRFLDVLKTAWRENFGDYTLELETLTRPDAWLKSANLSRVSARVYGHSADIADSDLSTAIGDVHASITPPRGSRYFPSALLAALVDRKVGRAQLLGLSEEPEEVKITLGDGEQAKTFVLGKERTPPVRTLVTDYGEPMLNDEQLRAWCLNDCGSHFKSVGVDWQTAWNTGAWSDDQLARTVAVIDDQQALGTAAG